MSQDDELGTHLLRSIVEVVRTVFGAKACSIMRFDADSDELVFEAVAGEGADVLPGRRIPSRTGVAGWVLASEEPIAIEDVLSDPRFDRSVAESTGYVPAGLTVYPLLYGERTLGVLNVLDRGATAPVGLADMEVLGRFAQQAAIAVTIVEAERLVPVDEGQRREAALALLRELEGLLSSP